VDIYLSAPFKKTNVTMSSSSTTIAAAEAKIPKDPEERSVNHILQLKFNPEFEFLSSGEGSMTRFAKAKRLTTLEFANVDYCRKEDHRLCNVSGSTQRREVLTLLGPPRAGKTKLLHCLAGVVRISNDKKQHLTGEFRTDGRPLFSVLRAGFVARTDIIFVNSTVEEELLFNATLRLPPAVTEQDRCAIVKDLLRSLGLETVAKTMIKKLPPATGLRKRVAIGMELAMCPNALFLDEPTSNLDCYPAWEILSILNAIAFTQTCIVVCSLASPPSIIFSELSQVMLLAQGHVVYRGHASGIQAAFQSKHLHCPSNFNPSEFAIVCTRILPLEALPNADEIITGEETLPNKDEMMMVTFSSNTNPAMVVPENNNNTGINRTNSYHYVQCERHRSTMVEFQQLLVREAKATRRDPRLFLSRLISTGLVMTLCACAFLHAGDQTRSLYFIGSDYGSFAFTMFSTSFSTMIPTVLFLFETKPVLVRECGALNMYGIMAFVLARLVAEVIINFVFAVMTVAILYWAVGWKGEFMLIVVAYYLLYLSAISWCYFLAYTVSSIAAAVGLVALVMVPQLLFLGTFVRIDALPIWLQWVSYLCFVTYCARLVLNFNFSQSYCIPNVTCALWQGLINANIAYPDETWWFILVLVVFFFILLRVLAFLIIHRKIRYAQKFGEI